MRTSFLYFTLFLLASLLSACADNGNSKTLFQYRKGFSVNISEAAQRGISNMGSGDFKAAHQEFDNALRYSPANCELNFLNALAYHIEGGKGNVKELELAEVGYQIAIRFCPSDPWPHYYYGLLLSKQKDYAKAENQFSLAVQYDKNKGSQHFLNAYLVSSYNNGNYLVASRLIRELNRIDPEDNKYSAMIKARLTQLATSKNDFTKAVWKDKYEKLSKKQSALPHSKKQLVIDAVIILSQETASSATGLNLLNGLQLTYGASNAFANVNADNIFDFMRTTKNIGTQTSPSMNTLPFSRVITNTITIPAVTYSLNIFNQINEKSEILARPSLLVEDGGKATYFSGDQLMLGIQGTQTGTITEKNIGVDLEVAPQFQDNGSIDLNVAVSRTFLKPASSDTTFQQIAETIRESTHTQVNLRYGETAILSALTESVQVEGKNQTPFLSQIPLLKYFFSEHEKKEINNNVLILLTPRPYVSIDSNVGNKRIEQQLNKVYHQVIDPATNLNRILLLTQTMRSIYRPVSISLPLYDSEFLKKAANQEYEMLTEEQQ